MSTFYFCIISVFLTVLQGSSTDKFWWPLPEQNIEFSCPVIQYEWWFFILLYNLFEFRCRKMCCLFKWWYCGVGSYVVQPLTIKWKTNNSSDLGIITVSRSNLAELIKTTLDVLLHQLHHAIIIVINILLGRLILEWQIAQLIMKITFLSIDFISKPYLLLIQGFVDILLQCF